MIGLALLIAMVPQSAATDRAETYVGRCEYAEHLREYRGTTDFAICDTLTLSRGDEFARFSFGDRSSGEATIFRGRMVGDVLRVDRITLASSLTLTASGQCKVFQSDGTLLVASCSVRARTRGYAANFVKARN